LAVLLYDRIPVDINENLSA